MGICTVELFGKFRINLTVNKTRNFVSVLLLIHFQIKLRLRGYDLF